MFPFWWFGGGFWLDRGYLDSLHWGYQQGHSSTPPHGILTLLAGYQESSGSKGQWVLPDILSWFRIPRPGFNAPSCLASFWTMHACYMPKIFCSPNVLIRNIGWSHFPQICTEDTMGQRPSLESSWASPDKNDSMELGSSQRIPPRSWFNAQLWHLQPACSMLWPYLGSFYVVQKNCSLAKKERMKQT